MLQASHAMHPIPGNYMRLSSLVSGRGILIGLLTIGWVIMTCLRAAVSFTQQTEKRGNKHNLQSV